jgi:hypothetical protein
MNMKKSNLSFKILLLTLTCGFCMTGKLVSAEMSASMAKQAPPKPPLTNPHAPETAEDKKRVAFAELIVKKLLIEDLTKKPIKAAPSPINKNIRYSQTRKADYNITLKCLNTPICFYKPSIQNYIKSLKARFSQYGGLTEIRHAHIIPWSFQRFKNLSNNIMVKPKMLIKPGYSDTKAMSVPVMQKPNLKADEYIVHIYGKYGNRWHHIDVILSEDAKGNLNFRRFFIVPIPYKSSDLPDGVVC